jgi:potassium-transporting ATPase KdpC subunit
MLDIFLPAARASVVTFILCGLIYPLGLTELGQLTFPFQANGSRQLGPDRSVVGSRLIGQSWEGPEWFHGRPSATTAADPNDPSKNVLAPYNAASSAGSNFGPTSKNLADRLAADRKRLEASQPELAGRLLPADMLTTSASGLDTDISPANAALQAPRIAQARSVSAAQVERLLERYVTGRSLGIFGEPRVNVLALNLALLRSCGMRACPDASDIAGSGKRPGTSSP